MKLSLITLIIIISIMMTRLVPVATQNLFFSESEFKRSIQSALKSVKSILETTRNPILLEADTDHTYQDKYALVEFVINSAIASYGNVLKHVGMKEDVLHQVLQWTHDSKMRVELEFVGTMWSEYVKEEERKISSHEYEKKKVVGGDNEGNTIETLTIKQKVWDVHHTLNLSFELNVKCKDTSLPIIKHSVMSVPIVVTHLHEGETKQLINSKCKESLDLDWFLQMIPHATTSSFIIDRQQNATCKTPIRNEDVKRAIDFATDIYHWSASVDRFLVESRQFLARYDAKIQSLESSPPVVSGEDVFVPIVPLFENASVLSKSDLEEMLNLQVKTLKSVTDGLVEKYASVDFFSSDRIVLEVSVCHLNSLPKRMMSSIAHVEYLLKTQLFQAIGKEITAEDFDKFMKFHNQKFFDMQYAPRPFSYSVRRPGFYPDGVISVESSSDAEGFAPIETLVQAIAPEKAPSITIPVDAATSVELEGQLYLHGWMQHVWQSGLQQAKSHQIVARAHEFSRFLLIVGTMGGPNVFLPKHAIILKDKDEIIIPLLTDILPSAKEFKDAIASLSPEQQEFAKAFRAMQLESSVFGICVIQLKPQLEKLLNLPVNSLTKEIQLTQDLMSLFVDYQIPSDLLSFDGPDVLETREKVAAVKGHVEAVLNVIEGQKKKQLQDAKAQYKAEAMMADDGTVRAWGKQQQQQMMAGSSMPLPAPLSVNSVDKRHIKTSRRLRVDPVLQEAQSITPNSFHTEGDMDTMQSPDFETNIPGTRKESNEVISSPFMDFTIIPKILDQQLEKYDVEGSLKSTILKVGEPWERLRKENLLVAPRRSYLSDRDREVEKHKAMDLLKALSRSGSLPIIQSELHVIISMSHCFDKNIVETVIEDNTNPIQKVERSMLMLGSVIHGMEKEKLLAPPPKSSQNLTIEAER